MNQQETSAQPDEQLWKVFDCNGKVYGTYERRTAWELARRVQSENPGLKSVGICFAEMEPVQTPAWFDNRPEDL